MNEYDAELEQFAKIGLKRIEEAVGEHAKAMIKYRLELIQKRYAGYEAQGLSIDEARELEKERFEKLKRLGSHL